MKQIPNKALCLLLAALLALVPLAPAARAAEDDTVSLRTADDLLAFAQNCTLDSWSRGKTVRLEADIDLTDVDFTPIPTFGGTFEGGGHTISGLSLTGSGNVRGLFRYIQTGGTVRNLTVKGSIDPTDRKDTLGLLAGSNRGTVSNVSAQGAVSGTASIGGLVGINEAEGQLVNCTFSGTVEGEHYVGGITGQNHGSVVQCDNQGSVNITEVDTEVDLDQLNTDQINATENAPVCTDIGGIAGYSAGILQNCTNTGAVGYAHVGYNIGGIVGRQSGYLDGCANAGTILGRKDVGGVAGQLEPEVRLLYSEGQMGQLMDALDTLQDLIDRTGDDLRGASDTVSTRMQAISDRAGQAQQAIDDFADAATDWADGNIDQINDLSARMSWLLDELSPLMDDAADVTDLMTDLSDQLNDAMDEALDAGTLGEDAAERLADAMAQLRQAAESGGDALAHLKEAWTQLRGAIGEPEPTEQAIAAFQQASADLTAAWSSIADSMAAIQAILRQAGGELTQTPEGQALVKSLGELQTACAALPGCIKAVSDALAKVIQTSADDAAALAALQEAVTELLGAGQNFTQAGMALAQAMIDVSQGGGSPDNLNAAYTALQAAYADLVAAQQKVADALAGMADADALTELQAALDALNAAVQTAQAALANVQAALDALAATDTAQQTVRALQTQLNALDAGLTAAAQAAQTLAKAAAVLAQPSVDSDALEQACQQAEAAGDDLAAAVRKVRQGLETGADAARRLRDMLSQAGDAGALLRDAGDIVADISLAVADLGASFADVMRELSEKPAISIRPVGSALQQKGDALGDVFSGLIDDGDALRQSVEDAADTLMDNLDAISDQFGVITDLLRDILDGEDETDDEDRFEDVSDQEDGTTDTGTVSNVRNTGTVEGDVNVAGIVGSMAIEYDFDPEDDLTEEGDRSLDFRYQTRAVVRSSVNTGTVTGKQDYAGGVVGRMDLGRVSGCENYGTVASTNGDYTGGIAGASWGTVRGCWSKCHLSGTDYIGGIAGLAATVTDCHALTAIDEGASYLGAVAGDADADGTLSGNTFTGDGLGAVDGISYAGKAEPVPFETLCATAGAPDKFSELELTFVADGGTVAVVPFQYGQGLDALPDIPAKPGYSAAWPELDYACLTASQTVEAVYTPYSSALTDEGGLPQILVDGSFGARATVTHTTEEVSWTDGQTAHSGTAYTVTVDDPDLVQSSFTVHYRLPDLGKRYTLWLRDGDSWQQADYTIDGQYLLLGCTGVTVTFCVTERTGGLVVVLLAAAAAATALLVAGYCLRRRRRKKGKQ